MNWATKFRRQKLLAESCEPSPAPPLDGALALAGWPPLSLSLPLPLPAPPPPRLLRITSAEGRLRRADWKPKCCWFWCLRLVGVARAGSASRAGRKVLAGWPTLGAAVEGRWVVGASVGCAVVVGGGGAPVLVWVWVWVVVVGGAPGVVVGSVGEALRFAGVVGALVAAGPAGSLSALSGSRSGSACGGRDGGCG